MNYAFLHTTENQERKWRLPAWTTFKFKVKVLSPAKTMETGISIHGHIVQVGICYATCISFSETKSNWFLKIPLTSICYIYVLIWMIIYEFIHFQNKRLHKWKKPQNIYVYLYIKKTYLSLKMSSFSYFFKKIIQSL